ncbi:hypothetical protein CWI37_0077p0030 [Hamiltosporidium tvaerminnensis]|uniref:Uncharacterized protein n=1 Tax=Hamiltosporidium tvaerminnensis TaxID=1176355 RepID=A0A4V2JVQ3_9MICR|nr:hypothetical protein LUQ84_002750 [Hamiltosporidium tvaerminnensis]TBU04872.1 hypothetical protein CWI37_0077p0030 [Hamiltosporidium tvaerminnensis]
MQIHRLPFKSQKISNLTEYHLSNPTFKRSKQIHESLVFSFYKKICISTDLCGFKFLSKCSVVSKGGGVIGSVYVPFYDSKYSILKGVENVSKDMNKLKDMDIVEGKLEGVSDKGRVEGVNNTDNVEGVNNTDSDQGRVEDINKGVNNKGSMVGVNNTDSDQGRVEDINKGVNNKGNNSKRLKGGNTNNNNNKSVNKGKGEGVNNNTNEQQGVNNNTNKQQGVNNNTNEQQGVNISTDKKNTVNNLSNKQQGVNNTTNKQNPVNNLYNKKNPVNNLSNKQNPVNNLSNDNPFITNGLKDKLNVLNIDNFKEFIYFYTLLIRVPLPFIFIPECSIKEVQDCLSVFECNSIGMCDKGVIICEPYVMNSLGFGFMVDSVIYMEGVVSVLFGFVI